MRKIAVISAFDGISCLQLALTRAGITIGSYHASEICPDAIGVTQKHFPTTIQLGDIAKVDGRPFHNKIQVFGGGSPCQSFSNAGIREGFDGKSKLFFEWLRLWEEIDPQYWILENVVMKEKWANIISGYLGREPIFINSAVGTAQNRPRMYWTNIPYTPIEDKEIYLGDVILGAVTGASKHGYLNPLYGQPGETKWKNRGWEFNVHHKANCLVLSTGYYKNIQGEIKKLTPEDCEALQTIPMGYTGVTGLRKTRRIKLLGNAWTTDILAEAFFKNLPWANPKKMSMGLKQKMNLPF